MPALHIESKHLEIVRKILNPYHQDFYVFGSRSKGNQRPLSDLDIISKKPLSKLQISEINELLEESNLPFKVDLILWDQLEESFKKIIQADLKKIF